MANRQTNRRKDGKVKKHAGAASHSKHGQDIKKLVEAVAALDVGGIQASQFEDLPLSEYTHRGLKACHYTKTTGIQAKAIPLALKGRDILGAAQTGSGKTLAFLIPVLENLYRSQCIGAEAGLGGMIISPTRELAIQIFEVLYKIGKYGHLFAAGLIIGGKSLAEERHALARMNIVVCTPGRMLQHLSTTPDFGLDQLQMLVLDEADRCLDMGFERDLNAIIDYLPPKRQTLCFSATQTKRVSDLARLSLRDPEYISIHEAATAATPSTLQQNYVVTSLADKLDTLWSFLRSSKKSKILVFLSSGKQVRYVYEAFRKLQPGIPLMHLHGRQKQTARLDITTRFSAARHACLFATDIAARGLDYPAVDWVVQVDCPEDVDTYIHRVGRTARYESEGKAVIFLDPSEEEAMLTRLLHKKVPIERINVRQKKQQSIKPQLQGMCFKDPELKYLGQKAFASYAHSIHLQRDKEVFKVEQYGWEDFAASLGLPGAPKIKFMKGDAEAAKQAKNAPRMRAPSIPSASDVDEDNRALAKSDAKDSKPVVRTKYDRMFERKNQDILADHYTRMIDYDNDDSNVRLLEATAKDDDEDLFTVKQRIPAATGPAVSRDQNGVEHPVIDSKRRERALKSKKKTAKLLGESGTRLVFDEETGEARPPQIFDNEKDLWRGDADEKEMARRRFVEDESGRLKEVDKVDKEVAKQKRREKREKRKRRDKDEPDPNVGAKQELSKDVEDPEEDDELDSGLPMEDKPFEELAGLYSDDDSGMRSPPRNTKRRKKWFETSDEGEKQRSNQPELQTVEDLERMAGAVLGQ
ncbi:MAG: ATP-dependent RNA helicase dbp4 [Chrysothrix sp. TS-e1954]|nr:MAG: ATP-dependent RNA helicase dbp4 [Chrysothrix sp. TS-e1954]